MISGHESIPPTITIHATGGTSSAAYIFDHNDAFLTRRHYRIQGDFIGTLPKHTSQNQYLSLPLALSYDEARFGISRGFFRLAHDAPAAYTPVDEVTVRRFFEDRRREVDEQADTNVKAQMAERARRTKGQKRKRENMEEQSLQETDVQAVAEPPPKVAKLGLFGRLRQTIQAAFSMFVPQFRAQPAVEPLLEEEDNHEDREEEHERAKEAARQAALESRLHHQARQTALVVTATAYRGDERADDMFISGKLKAPQGMETERLEWRARVFAALHDRGYYLSCGAKFGADFLAYAGDPVLFHAALAVVVVGENESLSALDVVALGRLGNTTKKRTVLAYVDKEVRFVGIQWEETLP